MSVSKAFNNHFMEFLEDVMVVLPGNKNIKTAKFYVTNLNRLNPTLVIKAWHLYCVLPYSEQIENGDFSFNYYAFFVVAATILYGINANLIKHYLALMKSLSIASISLTIVGPLSIIYLLFLTPFLDHIHEPKVLVASSYIVILGVFGTAFALILFNKMVQLTNPVFSTSVTYLIPIISVFWGVIDGEKLNPLQFVSMLIIMIGIAISNKRKHKKPE